MRVAHAFFAALFVFAASLQFNDPDPLRWVTMYLAAALPCVLSVARRPAAAWVAAVVGLIALAWAFTYLPAVLRHGQVLSMFDEWTMRNEEVLENREMFGLLIVAGWMAVIVATARRGAKPGATG